MQVTSGRKVRRSAVRMVPGGDVTFLNVGSGQLAAQIITHVMGESSRFFDHRTGTVVCPSELPDATARQ